MTGLHYFLPEHHTECSATRYMYLDLV
eukprot:COSAG05_NODE_20087_length_283_cov_0.847826_2_plen_26_part_01